MRSLASIAAVLLVSSSVIAAEPQPAARFEQTASARPNIVWIIVDDMSANFSCYGETAIKTPHVDRLAREGTRFTRAFVTAPVCSTCRSAFITGMYQTSIGAHHHRSGRGELKIHLPEGVVPIPKLFQEAGYYTSITGWPVRPGRLGKTDYNFEWDSDIYDGADWSDRKEGQPFFAQIQLPGGKLRGGTTESARKLLGRVKQMLQGRRPEQLVQLPPYYPSEPAIVEDWAAYLGSVWLTDAVVGEIVQRLESEGILEQTVIVFMTDHGISHARGKQFLYEEGIHVPLVIRGPGVAQAVQRDDLVEHIDIAAVSLALAGIPIPPSMEARNILASDYTPREYVFSARDRCDETVDHLRSVRSQRFKYIRNFLPQRPYLQPNAYKDKKSILIALRAAHEAGRLNEVQSRILASTRPPEELYDLQRDPFELVNLAADDQHAGTLKQFRQVLDDWMSETGDQGREPESAEMFDSDMAVYLNSLQRRKRDPAHLARIKSNIALMKRWAAAGK